MNTRTFPKNPPHSLRRAGALLTASAAAVSLSGCAKSWSVEVHNMTDQPLQATVLIYETGVSNPHSISRQVPPADRWESGRLSSSSLSRAEVEVDFQGNVGGSVIHPLKQGRTTLEVRRPAGEGSRGRIEVLEVQ